MNNVASVKDRLKNLSVSTGKTMQEMFVAYALERTIYRLSISPYLDNFVLKGGIFLYAVFSGNYTRATTDIDLLAIRTSNDEESIRRIFAEVFSIEADDPLRYDLESLRVTAITEFKDYHGVNVSVMSYLERSRIPVSIDIGFGDVIYPGRVEMDFPVVLSETSPRVYAYSLSSCVAEKFEAIVSLGYDNSRFKDFYDIYSLAISYDFDGAELSKSLQETFEHRHTSMEEIVAFEPGFTEEPLRQSRWNGFVKKKKAMTPVTLEETVKLIKTFLTPVMEGTKLHWSHERIEWV